MVNWSSNIKHRYLTQHTTKQDKTKESKSVKARKARINDGVLTPINVGAQAHRRVSVMDKAPKRKGAQGAQFSRLVWE